MYMYIYTYICVCICLCMHISSSGVLSVLIYRSCHCHEYLHPWDCSFSFSDAQRSYHALHGYCCLPYLSISHYTTPTYMYIPLHHTLPNSDIHLYTFSSHTAHLYTYTGPPLHHQGSAQEVASAATGEDDGTRNDGFKLERDSGE